MPYNDEELDKKVRILLNSFRYDIEKRVKFVESGEGDYQMEDKLILRQISLKAELICGICLTHYEKQHIDGLQLEDIINIL